MKTALYVVIGVFTGFILAAILFIVTRLPAGQPVTLAPSPTQAPIVIQIIGEVTRPGVYTLADGSRVEDAVNAAGGLLADADSSSINLAARLEDGQQISVPAQGGGGTSSSASNSSRAPFSVVTTLTPTSIPQPTLVNINIATLQQLDTLPGIGPVTAQSIVTYRQQHGPFQHIEDIMNVPGIGPATFDQIKDLITVGG